VASAAIGDSGVIVFVHSGGKAVSILDARDAEPRPIGRLGRGPGEYQSVTTVLLTRGDSILIYDSMLNRISFFARDGSLLGTVSVAPGVLCCSPAGWYLERRSRSGADAAGYQRARYSVGWWTSNPAARVQTNRTFELAVTGPTVVLDAAAGGSGTFTFGKAFRLPLSPAPMTVLGVRGVYHGVGSAAGFEYFGLDSSSDWRSPAVAPRRPVPARERALLRDSLIALATSDEERAQLASAIDRLGIPREYPTFANILLTSSDEIWVGLSVAATQSEEWLAFSADGQLIGTLSAPRNLRVIATSHAAIVGTREDSSTGLQRVELFPIRRRVQRP
jgi:hypothetical protein